jgi:hydrogenase maturation protease
VLEAKYLFPEKVTVLDVGTPGLDLVPYVADAEALVIVDTVRSKGAGGELRLYRRDEILRHSPPPRVSPHDPGLKETLLSLEFANRGPTEVLLVGVIPESTAPGDPMSPAVREALPFVEAAVLRELERLGCAASLRPVPLEPDFWWER